MVAIILAAGRGSRMKELTCAIPKTMIEIDDESILASILSNLFVIGIKKVVIVVGYKNEAIIDYFGYKYNDIVIEYVFNKEYETTNNIYSLWLCKEYMLKNNCLIIESDLIFDFRILKDVISFERNVIAVDYLKGWMNGTTIKTNIKGKYYKSKSHELPVQENDLKTINIYKFNAKFSAEKYLPVLNKAIEIEKRKSIYYEDIITDDFINDDFEIYIPNRNFFWYEIDTKNELEEAKSLSKQLIDPYDIITTNFLSLYDQNCIKDFYYLSNPFFPHRNFFKELSSKNLLNIVNSYPSGRATINSLLSELYKVNQSYIVSGNGSSELIASLFEVLSGSVGLILPSFDEYFNRLNSERIIIHASSPDNFNITFLNLKEVIDKCDIVVIVNPNNPTGSVVTYEDIVEMLIYMNHHKKFLILDESFIDFADGDISLLKNEILYRFNNLVIIKSFGKSYGVPGIRLGALFSSNKDIILKLNKRLPIWNISTFAEYFLKQFKLFRDVYIASCKKIIQERNRFIQKLLLIDDITVFESNANFILIKIHNCKPQDNLARQLLKKYNILVKDCTYKNGIESSDATSTYWRISVKTPKQNKLFINSLKELLLSYS